MRPSPQPATRTAVDPDRCPGCSEPDCRRCPVRPEPSDTPDLSDPSAAAGIVLNCCLTCHAEVRRLRAALQSCLDATYNDQLTSGGVCRVIREECAEVGIRFNGGVR